MVRAEARGGGVGDGTHEAHTAAGSSPHRHRVDARARRGDKRSVRGPSTADVLGIVYCRLKDEHSS